MTDTFYSVALRCSDFPEADECCDSCHEDEAMGYGMCELRKIDGDPVDAVVCCRVMHHIEETKTEAEAQRKADELNKKPDYEGSER